MTRQLLGAAFALLAGLALLAPRGGEAAEPGHIIRLATEERVPFHRLVRELADADIVLVGERHDDFAQHRVQQQVITGLLAHGPVAVGMEAFPGDKDAVLADWSRGLFPSWPRFLAAVDWFGSWGVDPALYRPILDTVRRNRLPLVGMNVPRQWIGQIGRGGMQALSPDQKQRIGPVAPAPEAYAEALRRSLAEHAGGGQAAHFIAAQTAWDAAMAGALLELKKAQDEAVVVGLAGTGHIRGDHGIPHQIASRAPDLEVVTVVPRAPERGVPAAGTADYAWLVTPDRAGEVVRIGARLGEASSGAGVAVAGVEPDYPAKAAGLRKGDRILAVDGQEVANATGLIYRIRQHQWGGCLRLTIRRDGDKRQLTVALDAPPESRGGH